MMKLVHCIAVHTTSVLFSHTVSQKSVDGSNLILENEKRLLRSSALVLQRKTRLLIILFNLLAVTELKDCISK